VSAPAGAPASEAPLSSPRVRGGLRDSAGSRGQGKQWQLWLQEHGYGWKLHTSGQDSTRMQQHCGKSCNWHQTTLLCMLEVNARSRPHQSCCLRPGQPVLLPAGQWRAGLAPGPQASPAACHHPAPQPLVRWGSLRWLLQGEGQGSSREADRTAAVSSSMGRVASTAAGEVGKPEGAAG
jgi:hypothetical protein